jgi:hypothetical protein
VSFNGFVPSLITMMLSCTHVPGSWRRRYATALTRTFSRDSIAAAALYLPLSLSSSLSLSRGLLYYITLSNLSLLPFAQTLDFEGCFSGFNGSYT